MTDHPADPVRVAGYQVVRRLGEGGQGTVFLGESPDGGRAAIKMLHSCVAADSQVRQRFWCEAEIAARVATFSTARVLETGFAGENPYIISEYVPGPSLEELVRVDGPRRGSGLERLAVTTLTALVSIHAAGVVHRDVKPANVIMGPEGPVLIDFGIAMAANTAAATSTPVGTPAYMAPEQFNDQPSTAASDMFAWAGTMVYAATGRPAFLASTVPATFHAILHSEPDLSGLPEGLRSLVAACLAKNPAARPTAGQALCDLIGGDNARPFMSCAGGNVAGERVAAGKVASGRVSGGRTPRDAGGRARRVSGGRTRARGARLQVQEPQGFQAQHPEAELQNQQARFQVQDHEAQTQPSDRPRRRRRRRQPGAPVARRRRPRTGGRHAGAPDPMPPAPTSTWSRWRRSLALLTGGAAMVVMTSTLVVSSVFGASADMESQQAQGHQAEGHTVIPPCAPRSDPSATSSSPNLSWADASTTCDLNAGQPR